MTDQNANDIKTAVDAFQLKQPWNHNFILPGNVETRKGDFVSPAKNRNKLKRLEEIFNCIDLKGKSVFDVGCNEGFFSIEMAERGASVTGLDVDTLRVEKAEFVKSLLAPHQPIEYVCENFLTTNKELGLADVVLCLGFLHRVPDPISAIAKLAAMGDTLIFEWKAQFAGAPHFASASFTEQTINETDTYGTEYWLLSVDAVRSILARYGFNNTYLLTNPGGKREIIVASKTEISGLKVQNERSRLLRSAVRQLKNVLKTLANR